MTDPVTRLVQGIPLTTGGEPFNLYHWSPARYRDAIALCGLTPGERTFDDRWNAPYLCFGDSPRWAWSLSGALRPDDDWDLWSISTSDLERIGWEEVPPHPHEVARTRVHEYRVYARLPASSLWYVASRRTRPCTNAS